MNADKHCWFLSPFIGVHRRAPPSFPQFPSRPIPHFTPFHIDSKRLISYDVAPLRYHSIGGPPGSQNPRTTAQDCPYRNLPNEPIFPPNQIGRASCRER